MTRHPWRTRIKRLVGLNTPSADLTDPFHLWAPHEAVTDHPCGDTDDPECWTTAPRLALPRWIHRTYAHALGFFWLPCPTCRRMFGGHERGNGAVFPDPGNPWTGRVVCARCARRGPSR